MTAAVFTTVIGLMVRLVVPFTLLILLTRSLNWVAETINEGSKH